ncbi:MAG TPA: HlyD family efflux transporter periplasmic adaptor subunit [Duganella sp.]|jgi:membrane fusion protein|uniref:HlyD family efflux transporter periplasmic adaptor subunit n=1 Tax=Duganella sp. TaxID=1904440 RepID=UPI002ED52754
MPTYRKEASDAHRANVEIFGDVILTSPWHHRLFAIGGALLGLALILVLAFGQYSRRITAAGQLLPEQGVVRLYSQTGGTLRQALFREGEKVPEGALLFKLANQRFGADGRDANSRLLGTIAARSDALERELLAQESLARFEENTLKGKIETLVKSERNLREQTAIVAEKLRIAKEAEINFGKLTQSGYISGEQYRQKQQEVLAQSLALTVLQRQAQELDEALSSARRDLQALPLKQENTRSALYRSYQESRADLVTETAARESAVVAPLAGKLTAVMVKPGGQVAPGQLLGTLVPSDSPLQAHLYVPSHGIGFITVGARVHLRYRAYPYQKYGQATGIVTDISATSLRADELDNNTKIGELSNVTGAEPVYRVRVTLASQYVAMQGRRFELLAGALFDADIVLDRKPLYRWILDPVEKFSNSQNL